MEKGSIGRSLHIPTMTIWGKQGKILAGAEQIPLLQQAMNIQSEDVHVRDDAAHFIQEEYPDKIANWIGAFLQRSE